MRTYGPQHEKTCLRGFANNKDADQRARPCSLISAFVIRFLERIIASTARNAKRVANNVSSYGRDMVQNGLGFMHCVSLKSHGPVLLSMKLLPYPVNQSCFPSALDKLNETALRRMVPAVTSLAN